MTTSLLIRPAYRHGRFIGFALHTGREFVGKVYRQYKHAALAQVQS
jgi:hypothetical protein